MNKHKGWHQNEESYSLVFSFAYSGILRTDLSPYATPTLWLNCCDFNMLMTMLMTIISKEYPFYYRLENTVYSGLLFSGPCGLQIPWFPRLRIPYCSRRDPNSAPIGRVQICIKIPPEHQASEPPGTPKEIEIREYRVEQVLCSSFLNRRYSRALPLSFSLAFWFHSIYKLWSSQKDPESGCASLSHTRFQQQYLQLLRPPI